MHMKIHWVLACFILCNIAAVSQQNDTTVLIKKDSAKHVIVDRNSIVDVTADSSDLTVFFKPGCTRCETFRKMLDEKCIPYTSVDMSTDDPRILQMWKDIQTQGFNGGTIRYPIVRYQGTVIWDMIDMNAFIESLPH